MVISFESIQVEIEGVPVTRPIIPVHILHRTDEDYMVETVSRWLGGYLEYSFEPEIDGIVVDRKGRPRACTEVKWGRLRNADVDAFVEKTEHIDAPRYVVAKRAPPRDDVTFITPGDLRGMFAGEGGP